MIIKICPCCGERHMERYCPNCLVYTGETFDPDDLMGEYEEENE